MTAPAGGAAVTCEPWPLVAALLPTGWDVTNLNEAQRSARDTAQDILGRLSGGRYGVCQLTVRPVRRSWAYGQYGMFAGGGLPWGPTLFDGRVYAVGCGCPYECGHPWPGTQIELPGPVQSVDKVLVDGQEVPADAYRVDDKKYLVRTDGKLWPWWQDLNKDTTAADTFAVTLRRGAPVTPAGEAALTAFTLEISKARSGDKSCKLPARVTQIVREGVTYTMLDNLEILDKGRVGVPEVDMWLAAVNPNNARSRMAAWSPDLPAYRRTTS